MRFCAHELSRGWSLARTYSLWYTSDKHARTRTPLAQPRIWEAWFKRTLACTVIFQLAMVPREFYSRLDTLSWRKSLSFLLIDASHLLFSFFTGYYSLQACNYTTTCSLRAVLFKRVSLSFICFVEILKYFGMRNLRVYFRVV